MGVEYTIRERAALLISNAKSLKHQLEEQGIQLAATVKYEDAEVWISHGYKDDGAMSIRIDWKEPTCDSAKDVAKGQLEQQS